MRTKPAKVVEAAKVVLSTMLGSGHAAFRRFPAAKPQVLVR